MSLGSPDFYKAIVGVGNKKSLRTPGLEVKLRKCFSTRHLTLLTFGSLLWYNFFTIETTNCVLFRFLGRQKQKCQKQ
jgi:hypothetical protein